MNVNNFSAYQHDYNWNKTTPYSVEEFFSILDQFVENSFYGFSHPLGKKLLAGEFSPDELKFLAKQEYFYYWGTTWWNAFKLGNAATLSQQRKLHDALLDELGTDLIDNKGLPAHSELFLKYCEGLGLSLQEITNAPITAGVSLAITEL
ncbi:hypothetical protein FJ364_03700, partial [Candidatus Dependentiae bacterium]|nr:hypothetical protein [Candidatus Dependentiae bacterium]